jgi:hypothetical protein
MLFYNLAILIKGKQIVHISSKVWGSEHRCLQICDIKLKVLICHNWNLYILIVTFRTTTYNQQNKQNVRRAWKCLRCPEDSAFIGPSFSVDNGNVGIFLYCFVDSSLDRMQQLLSVKRTTLPLSPPDAVFDAVNNG